VASVVYSFDAFESVWLELKCSLCDWAAALLLLTIGLWYWCIIVLWVESGRTPLSWTARVQIALDAARGLEYIHEHTKPTYIHRDIKSANILIDKELHAKVTSFITGTQSGCDFHSFWCLSWREFWTSGALCFQLCIWAWSTYCWNMQIVNKC